MSIAFWSGVALGGKATKKLLPAEQQALQNDSQCERSVIIDAETLQTETCVVWNHGGFEALSHNLIQVLTVGSDQIRLT